MSTPSTFRSASSTLADQIERLLPQTQCTKCGYASCRAYAEAIAAGDANYNQCPPGGADGVARLATLLEKPPIPLNPENGTERARPVAFIDEDRCIGCTLCIQACPVDAIVGAAKQMHTILPELCTGCDLCVPACPVDCITMLEVTPGRSGWEAWSPVQADAARTRYHRRQQRLQRQAEQTASDFAARTTQRVGQPATAPVAAAPATAATRKQAIIAAALARAQLRQPAGPVQQQPVPAAGTDTDPASTRQA